jgi:hypothetical protein
MESAVRRCSCQLRISSQILCTAFFEIAGLKLQKSFPFRTPSTFAVRVPLHPTPISSGGTRRNQLETEGPPMAPIDSSRPSVLLDLTRSVSPVVFLRHLPSVSSPSALAAENSCRTTFDSRLGTGCSSYPARSLRSSARPFLLLPCCSSPFSRLPELLAVKYSTVLPHP